MTGMLMSEEVLTLEECIDLACSGNTSIRSKQLSADIAASRSRESFSPLMPHISVSSGLGSGDAGGWEPHANVGLSAGLTLYTPGLYSGIRSSKINRDIQEISVIGAENDVISQVCQIYYKLLGTRKMIKVYEANIELAEENLRKTRSMYQQRVVTESDVLKSEAQKGDFESQLLLQKQLYLNYQRTMNVLFNRDVNTVFQVADVDVDTIDIPAFDVALDLMLKQNPDYEALRLQEEISKILLQSSKEAYLPSLTGSYSYTNQFDPLIDPANSVHLTASWTLFNGLSRREQVQQRKLQLEQTRIDIAGTTRVLEQQLRDLYTQFDTYTSMIDINKRRLQSARRDFEIVNQQYQIGRVTILDRMQAQISVLSAESTLLEAQYSRKIVESEILKLINNI
jgi:outer membrane protein TolC